MRKLVRLLLRLSLFAFIVVVGIFTINTIRFASKQVKIDPIKQGAVDDATVQRFAQGIQFPTVSSESKVDTNAFEQLLQFIETAYPLADSLLEKEVVNQFSLIYKWQGRNPKLDPILLMGHTDVVPVEESSISKWEHAPFSGDIADGFIWGRGTLDDKLNVFGLLEAVSSLLEKNFTPERTVYLAFGHDEEVSGLHGAQAMAKIFKSRKINFEFILDEGSFTIGEALNGLEAPLAMIGIAEKGYTTLTVTASLQEGGHSSMPPAETAVGVLSKAIYTLQSNPFPAKIDGAVKDMLDYIGPEMSPLFKVIFANTWLTEGILKAQFSSSPQSAALIRTTTAPTMLRGGIKDNVLPTRASAKVNFRILPGETPESVLEYVRTIIDDPRVVVNFSEGKFNNAPSALSSTESFGFQIIQKTIQQINPEVVVAPSLVIGATDSRHYAELSENIYRYSPVQIHKSETKRIHGINERLSVDEFKQMTRFYHQLIVNATR